MEENNSTIRLLGKVVRPLQEFLRLEAAGGLVLMAATVLAMVAANSPADKLYGALLDIPVSIQFGTFVIAKPLLLWINDGLMAVFFLLVGMELKRELIEGHLSDLRNIRLPAFAAVGGMLGPAAIYALFNSADPIAMRGWAIPSATDIAFALGVLSLLGNRVPAALKVFLLSVAIFDDLGAILIIAFFYTVELSVTSIVIASLCVVGLAVINRLGVRRPGAYLVLGVLLWIAVLKSGVHATLAGVVLALFIPIKEERIEGREHPRPSMLHRLEHALHPWVAFAVLPIFAFANAGVSLSGFSPGVLFHPVPLGIIMGLFVGKLVGIVGMSALAVKLNWAQLPGQTRWRELTGLALLCGIGFTMSLFIASLAFEESGAQAYLGMERLGILVGSGLAGITGYLILRWTLPKTPSASASNP